VTVSNKIPTPDNLYWPQRSTIISAQIINKSVVVNWNDNQQSTLHPMWLRDNCCCEECLNSVTREHLLDLRDISPAIKPNTVEIDTEGALVVIWSEQHHRSRYNPDWLYTHSTGEQSQRDNQITLWSAADLSEPPSLDAVDGVITDELLHEALSTILRQGMVRLRGLPTDTAQVEALALRIGPIRETHFDRIFDVISKANSDTLANTSHQLAAHTDIPTRESPPGIQILHCRIAEAKGGHSTLTDGFKVAEDIRLQSPAHYKLLTSVNWCHANRAGPTDYRWSAPIIGLDDQGEPLEVRLLPFSRAPLQADYEDMDDIYAALVCFMERVNSPDYQISFPFAAGDLIMFDNRRVLHGRGEFYPKTGDRVLRGTYVERDDVRSKIREFEQQQHRKNSGLTDIQNRQV
jgi:gamma-butyrobetaine dioxygenase